MYIALRAFIRPLSQRCDSGDQYSLERFQTLLILLGGYDQIGIEFSKDMFPFVRMPVEMDPILTRKRVPA